MSKDPEDCPIHINHGIRELQCELPVDHEGSHSNGGNRWCKCVDRCWVRDHAGDVMRYIDRTGRRELKTYEQRTREILKLYYGGYR